MNKTIALYLRISVKQRDNDNIERQEEHLKSYVKYHNNNPDNEHWKVTKVYKDDGRTGRDLNRPAVRKLIQDMEFWADKVQHGEHSPIDIVLVKAIDRLARNTYDGLMLYHKYMKPCNIELISATQYFDTATSVGRLSFRTLLSMSEFESDMISERVKQGQAAARKRGFV